MNWLDFAVIAVLAICVIEGIWKGFVRTGIDFVLMAAGLVCALWFYHPFSFVLRPYIRPKELAELVAFMLLFGGIAAAGGILQVVFKRVVKTGNLGWPDRAIGGFFGVIRGLVSATVMVLVVMAVAPKPLPETVLDSRFAPSLIDGARCAAEVAPDEVRFGFRQACKDIERVLPPKWQKSLSRMRSI